MEGDPGALIAVAQAALWATAKTSAPILIPVLLVGLVTGVLQAATSVNEAALSFVPKLIVVGIMLALFGAAMLGVVADFTRDIFARLPEIVR